jgi:hypothetical protein
MMDAKPAAPQQVKTVFVVVGTGLAAAIAGLPDEVATMTRDETFKQQWPGQCPGHSVSKDIQS